MAEDDSLPDPGSAPDEPVRAPRPPERRPGRDPRLLASLEALIRGGFPMATFMEVDSLAWSDAGLVLRAPAGPNVNVHGTMFGGSVSALGTLAGWGWIRLELDARDMEAEVVVQDETTRFLHPIRGASVARCLPPGVEALDRFLRTLRGRGRARLGLRVEISPEDHPGEGKAGPAAVTEARFVARRPR